MEASTSESTSGAPGPAKPPPSNEKDPLAWTPWAVLAALVLVGLLGFLGVFSSKKQGPTAAEVGVEIPTAAPQPPNPLKPSVLPPPSVMFKLPPPPRNAPMRPPTQ